MTHAPAHIICPLQPSSLPSIVCMKLHSYFYQEHSSPISLLSDFIIASNCHLAVLSLNFMRTMLVEVNCFRGQIRAGTWLVVDNDKMFIFMYKIIFEAIHIYVFVKFKTTHSEVN